MSAALGVGGRVANNYVIIMTQTAYYPAAHYKSSKEDSKGSTYFQVIREINNRKWTTQSTLAEILQPTSEKKI